MSDVQDVYRASLAAHAPNGFHTNTHTQPGTVRIYAVARPSPAAAPSS